MTAEHSAETDKKEILVLLGPLVGSSPNEYLYGNEATFVNRNLLRAVGEIAQRLPYKSRINVRKTLQLETLTKLALSGKQDGNQADAIFLHSIYGLWDIFDFNLDHFAEEIYGDKRYVEPLYFAIDTILRNGGPQFWKPYHRSESNQRASSDYFHHNLATEDVVNWLRALGFDQRIYIVDFFPSTDNFWINSPRKITGALGHDYTKDYKIPRSEYLTNPKTRTNAKSYQEALNHLLQETWFVKS